MADSAYTMPGIRWAVLTHVRLNGNLLPAVAGAGLLLLAVAGFLHPEHLHTPSGGMAGHTRHHTLPHAVLVASVTHGAEVAQ
ncbi:hypothetical protein ACE4RV_09635 [Acetobacter persici]|uniref:hypothetical protein n=1 Tax=Acetobacter persici TaxID=1076596 RepID=UPI0036D9445D